MKNFKWKLNVRICLQKDSIFSHLFRSGNSSAHNCTNISLQIWESFIKTISQKKLFHLKYFKETAT